MVELLSGSENWKSHSQNKQPVWIQSDYSDGGTCCHAEVFAGSRHR